MIAPNNMMQAPVFHSFPVVMPIMVPTPTNTTPQTIPAIRTKGRLGLFASVVFLHLAQNHLTSVPIGSNGIQKTCTTRIDL